ncbi:angiopoietin-related protein 1-like isoform X2 [Toxorhynchites rutilus septentrionalis]|uniref:angiopoietin-related protein 1-like isoform X2 n=1 Tax=Toxorhynchites rutilus septentrionalis TaxID=329112 RepID=UPI002478FA40|nr:angiopoietin-related protein 1-like isoform X2 [Toxorhynchites rutilus septentrionalis]
MLALAFLIKVYFIYELLRSSKVSSARITFKSCGEAPAHSEIYWIRLSETNAPFQVFCEQEKFGGGWLVFQSRYDGTTSFNRTWNEYKYGFGDLRNNFWLGLDKLHQLTSVANYDLLISMANYLDFMAYQKYENFRVDGEDKLYSLNVSEQNTGTAGESLLAYNGANFSTFDKDNGQITANCASEMGGGFWHHDCRIQTKDRSNVNGLHSDRGLNNGIWWGEFGGINEPLKHYP